MSVLLYFFILIELSVVSYFDLKTKKISNLWSIFNMIFFLSGIWLIPVYHIHVETFVFPLAFLFVGFFLFALRIMGAGDVKYLFSFFLIVPQQYHEQTFLYLSYLTIIIGLILLVYNTAKNIGKIKLAFASKNVLLVKGIFGNKFSYAPVILFAWVGLGWKIYHSINF